MAKQPQGYILKKQTADAVLALVQRTTAKRPGQSLRGRRRRPGGGGGGSAPPTGLFRGLVAEAPETLPGLVEVYATSWDGNSWIDDKPDAWAAETTYPENSTVRADKADEPDQGVEFVWTWPGPGDHTSGSDPPGFDTTEQANWTQGARTTLDAWYDADDTLDVDDIVFGGRVTGQYVIWSRICEAPDEGPVEP